MLKKLQAKDSIIDYPNPENTGDTWRDATYNWVVSRYKKNGHAWRKSDTTVWKGFVYGVTAYIGYIIFFSLMMWLLMWIHDKYGAAKAIITALVILLARLNIMIKQLSSLNKRFQ
jgi:hypothetical protein